MPKISSLEQLQAFLEERDERRAAAKNVIPEGRAMDLQERYSYYTMPRDFKPGDLVEQIPALATYKWPEPGLPAIVINVGPPQALKEIEDGGPARTETMAVGVIKADGDFDTYLVEPQRFRKWTGA